jgi:hypothetical protein
MTLADYIRALVEGVGGAEPAGLERLRDIVGNRSALIVVDTEAAHVRFEADRLLAVAQDPGAKLPEADGIGETDRQTVLALLAGWCEVTDAITEDRLRLRGTTDGIIRMARALEILIDVAVRTPGLQRLAALYRDDPGLAPLTPRRSQAAPERMAARAAEHEVLARLGLLREPGRRW